MLMTSCTSSSVRWYGAMARVRLLWHVYRCSRFSVSMYMYGSQRDPRRSWHRPPLDVGVRGSVSPTMVHIGRRYGSDDQSRLKTDTCAPSSCRVREAQKRSRGLWRFHMLKSQT